MDHQTVLAQLSVPFDNRSIGQAPWMDRVGKHGTTGSWLCHAACRQPRTGLTGRPITENNLSLRVAAQVAAVRVLTDAWHGELRPLCDRVFRSVIALLEAADHNKPGDKH